METTKDWARFPVRDEVAERHNTGKAKLSYVLDAPLAIEGYARVMEAAEAKYPRGNWKKGRPYEDTIDSMLRHLTKFMNGETLDQESGRPHVDHITANAIILAENFHDDEIRRQGDNNDSIK